MPSSSFLCIQFRTLAHGVVIATYRMDLYLFILSGNILTGMPELWFYMIASSVKLTMKL